MTATAQQESRTASTTKKRRGVWAWLIGIVCGAELVFAAVIGGAGLGAVLGPNGAVVGAAIAVAVATSIRGRRRRLSKPRPGYGDPTPAGANE